MIPEFLGRNHPNKTMELFQLLQNRLFDEVERSPNELDHFGGDQFRAKNNKKQRQRKTSSPGDSKCPFHPLVGGHLTPWKGDLTIPKRSLWITRWSIFIHPQTFNSKKNPGKPWWYLEVDSSPFLNSLGLFSVKVWVGSNALFGLFQRVLTLMFDKSLICPSLIFGTKGRLGAKRFQDFFPWKSSSRLFKIT